MRSFAYAGMAQQALSDLRRGRRLYGSSADVVPLAELVDKAMHIHRTRDADFIRRLNLVANQIEGCGHGRIETVNHHQVIVRVRGQKYDLAKLNRYGW